MKATVFFIFLLVLVVGIPFLIFAFGLPQLSVDRQREAIERAFMAQRLSSEDPRFAFDPSSAVLVLNSDKTRGSDVRAVEAHRVYRNPFGEYFLFICPLGGAGYLEHLPKERAMNALQANPEILRHEFPNA